VSGGVDSGARRRADGEDGLVSDAIREIREAEKQSLEAERQARAESKRLIAAAHEGTERLLDEMRHAVRDEERTLTETARAEAEKEAAAIAAESRASIETLRAGAEAKVRQGVARVLDAIVSGS